MLRSIEIEPGGVARGIPISSYPPLSPVAEQYQYQSVPVPVPVTMRLSLYIVLGIAGLLVASFVQVMYIRPLPYELVEQNGQLAAVYRVVGGALSVERVKVAKDEDSSLGDFQVSVDLVFVGLNPVDFKMRDMALWCNARGGDHACGIGLEGTGRITAVGRNVTRVKVGQKVLISSSASLLRQHARVSEDSVAPLPSQWTLKGAAGMSVAGRTSIQALSHHCPIMGSTGIALVTGGSSPTGQIALQLLARASVGRIVATCGAGADQCRTLGATDVIDYRKESLAEGLARLQIRTIDLAYECVHTSELYETVRSLKDDACIVSIDPGHDSVLKTLWHIGSKVVRSWLGDGRYSFFLTKSSPESLDKLISMMDAKVLTKLQPLTEYPFTSKGVEDAIKHVENGKGGKVVVKVQQ